MYLYMKHSANHFPTSIDERTTVHDIGLYPCKVLSYEPEIIFSPYQRTDADVIALSLWMEWVPMEWVPKGVSWANQSDQNDNPTRYRLLGSRLSRIPNLTDPCPPKSQAIPIEKHQSSKFFEFALKNTSPETVCTSMTTVILAETSSNSSPYPHWAIFT